jgi:hypothetical protein
VKDILVSGFWAHFGAAVAVAIGVADLFHFHAFGPGYVQVDMAFIFIGLASFGVDMKSATLPK